MKPAALGSPKESFPLKSSGNGALSGLSVVVVIEVVEREAVMLFVMIVSESRGTLSFLVRRIEAEDALTAERRARRRGASGMRRLIVLFSTADWMVYVSKIVSCRNCQQRLGLRSHGCKLTMARTLSNDQAQACQPSRRTQDVRPHLTALLWYYGES